MMKRQCYACESNETWTDKYGYSRWYFNRDNDNNMLCQKCYNNLIGNRKWYPLITIEQKRRQWARHITFHGKRLYLKVRPRTGKCSKCGAIKGIDCDRTHIHHERYDKSNPLKHTIELCTRCHATRDWELKRKK